jgi:AraC-like DNA-binding protein
MEYREYEPTEALRRHVQCVWRLRDTTPSPEPQTIYPDGRCELIAHLGAPMRILVPERGWHTQPVCIFAGQHQAAIRLVAAGTIDVVGVRLRPAASAAIAGGRLEEFAERTVDLTLLDAPFTAEFSRAARAFAGNPDAPSFWRCLERRLLAYAIDERIEKAVAYLESRYGQRRIDATANAAEMGLRAFQSRFAACVGLGAKAFGRVLRLQATIRAIDRGSDSIATVAAESGFSDQAHATREVQRVTGLTPARLRTALRKSRNDDRTVELAAAFVRGGDAD